MAAYVVDIIGEDDEGRTIHGLETTVMYVDFYENDCDEGNPPSGGTLTVSGKDGEPLTRGSGCGGGAGHPGGSNSRSLGINGISGSGLVVDVYAFKDCNEDSFITSIAEDDCFTSNTGDPVNFVKVRKADE
ncbi:MAG: hypothetical protein Q9174_003508 [Haloplaca sp. 1 TL-2023]